MPITSAETAASVQHINVESFQDEAERAKARAEAAKLLARIEAPY